MMHSAMIFALALVAQWRNAEAWFRNVLFIKIKKKCVNTCDSKLHELYARCCKLIFVFQHPVYSYEIASEIIVK
jgi:hypothetical protein